LRGATGQFKCPGRMNTIPLPREKRQFFYKDVSESVCSALKEAPFNRMSIKLEIPETNPNNDVFRVGTLLELIRVLAGKMVEDGKKVRICVQGSMGKGVFQGLPLQLSGLRKLLDLMDWEEIVFPFVSFGAVGAAEVRDEDDIFLIVCPQNIVGASILPNLQAMCEKAGDRQVILLNPKLVDIPSAGNVMQVRGRAERMDFADEFKEIYHFRFLYRKPYFHPIYGLLRFKWGEPWEIYKRIVKKTDAGKEEKYCFAQSYDEEPKPPQITTAIAMDISF